MISVVIPTCRRLDLLGRCLDRLAPGTQTLAGDQYEVVVTDDGTPTAEALIRDKYPWATWVAGPRRGPASNRNNGARQARGEWVAFVDDDCVPAAGWLAAYAAAVHDGCEVYEGMTTCEAGCHSPLETAPTNTTGGWLWSCNMMIRRDRFLALGGFDEGFPYPNMEDVEFRERLLAAGHKFEFVPRAVVDHPPRRVPGGWRQGRYQASYVYYWYKSGHAGLCTPRYTVEIVKAKVKAVLRHPLQWDSLVTAGSLALELASGIPRMAAEEWRWRSRRRKAPGR